MHDIMDYGMHFKAVLHDIIECMIPVDISNMYLILVVVWDIGGAWVVTVADPESAHEGAYAFNSHLWQNYNLNFFN